MTTKLKAIDIELAVAYHFGIRTNLIVPNVSWGFGVHECDLLIVTPHGYVSEVEIKITESDLIADQKKRHNHCSEKIKYLWFALPKDLAESLYIQNLIPERAGIISVHEGSCCLRIRKPVKNGSYKLSDYERYTIARLGAMRIWGLKEKIIKATTNDKKRA